MDKIVGMRFENLEEIKRKIEDLTNKKVYEIVDEGATEATRDFHTDFEILYEFANYEQHTLFYLKDNANQYYITEV